jgi:hypothetical protein
VATKKIKSRVIIYAEDASGSQVDQFDVPYETFYGDGIPVIDSNHYRAERGIRVVKGTVYDSKGIVQQCFENNYAADGAYLTGRAVHADGTIIKD